MSMEEWNLDASIIANAILLDNAIIPSDFKIAPGVKCISLEPEFLMDNSQTGLFDINIKYEVDQTESSNHHTVFLRGLEIFNRFLDLISFISIEPFRTAPSVKVYKTIENGSEQSILMGDVLYERPRYGMCDFSIFSKIIDEKAFNSLRWFRRSIEETNIVNKFNCIMIAIEIHSNLIKEQISERITHRCKKCNYAYERKYSINNVINAYFRKFTDIPEDKIEEMWEERNKLKHGGVTNIYPDPKYYWIYYYYCLIAYINSMKKYMNMLPENHPYVPHIDRFIELPLLSIISVEDESKIEHKKGIEAKLNELNEENMRFESLLLNNNIASVNIRSKHCKITIRFRNAILLGYNNILNIPSKEIAIEEARIIRNSMRYESMLNIRNNANRDSGEKKNVIYDIGICAKYKNKEWVFIEIKCEDVEIEKITVKNEKIKNNN